MDYERLSKAKGVMQSKLPYIGPTENSSMAGELLEAFKRHSNRTLLVDSATRTEWTGSGLLDQVGRVACGLVNKLQLGPNDVVLSICEHAGAEVVLALGVVLAGGALYGSAASDGYEEWRTLCQLVAPKFIVTNARFHQQALELRRNLKNEQQLETHIIWIDNPLNTNQIIEEEDVNNNNNNNAKVAAEYYAELIERDQVCLLDDLIKGEYLDMRLLEKIAYSRINPQEHILTYMLTSGSTGQPKVVPSTHEELVHGIYSMLSACKNPIPPSSGTETKSCAKERLLMPDVNEDSVLAGDLPLDHGAGINTMFLSLLCGSKFIIMPSYSEQHFWQSVQDYKITASYSSTTFAYKLLLYLKQLIDTQETHRLQIESLKNITCAGSKLSFIELIREVQQHYKHISVRQCYGCTEVGFMTMLNRESSQSHLHSVGFLMPGLLAKVVSHKEETNNHAEQPEGDDKPHLCGPNEPGELLVWARSKFKSYRCVRKVEVPTNGASDVKENDSSNSGSQLIFNQCHDFQGFYRTGDQVHYDEEGRFYVHGRFKDTLFLDTDWKILPAELEDVVNQHPLVEFSAVIGLPNPDLPGCHIPRAFVKLIELKSKEYDELADEELRKRLLLNDRGFISANIYQFVADRTAEPKHLRAGVRILDEFPRNGLLKKIDRKALKLIE